MNKEIERKFLLKDNWLDIIMATGIGRGWDAISQGYLKRSKPVVRVRTYGGVGFITIKGSAKKGEIGVDEYEYEIPIMEAQKMLDDLCSSTIKKIRYKVDYKGHIWEIDEFLDENDGLQFAEIELKSEDEEFELPPFIGEEVTGQKEYYNNYIIKHPYNTWK